LILIVWSMSVWIYGELKKEKLILGRNQNFIYDYGLKKFITILVLLTFHPIVFTIDIPFFIGESYFRVDFTFEDFYRPIVEYCIMIQFILGIIFVITIFLENVQFGNNRADRIARFFGIEADAIFVLRASMKRYPLFFVICLEIFGIIFFGVLVRIAETNYI